MTDARYRTARWVEMRRQQLLAQPWCVMCRAMGRLTRASVADHRTPHRGSDRLFWDEGNLQSLCVPHHSGTKQRMEKGRATSIVGDDGWPVG